MPESIHLWDWPKADESLIDNKLEEKMREIREVVALALAERAKVGIKVRQPLASLKIKNQKSATAPPTRPSRKIYSKIKNNKELLNLIKEEVNIKEVVFTPKIKKEIELDVKITPKLKEEGMIREVIRHLQEMRKKAGYKPEHKILIRYSGSPLLNKTLIKNKKFILKETKAKNFLPEKKPRIMLKAEKEVKINGEKLWLGIKKV